MTNSILQQNETGPDPFFILPAFQGTIRAFILTHWVGATYTVEVKRDLE